MQWVLEEWQLSIRDEVSIRTFLDQLGRLRDSFRAISSLPLKKSPQTFKTNTFTKLTYDIYYHYLKIIVLSIANSIINHYNPNDSNHIIDCRD